MSPPRMACLARRQRREWPLGPRHPSRRPRGVRRPFGSFGGLVGASAVRGGVRRRLGRSPPVHLRPSAARLAVRHGHALSSPRACGSARPSPRGLTTHHASPLSAAMPLTSDYPLNSGASTITTALRVTGASRHARQSSAGGVRSDVGACTPCADRLLRSRTSTRPGLVGLEAVRPARRRVSAIRLPKGRPRPRSGRSSRASSPRCCVRRSSVRACRFRSPRTTAKRSPVSPLIARAPRRPQPRRRARGRRQRDLPGSSPVSRRAFRRRTLCAAV